MPTLIEINTTLNTGSTGRIAEQIAEKASSNGWDCILAHGGRYVGDSKFASIQISTKADNYLHAIQGEFLGRHGWGSTNATQKFVRRIEEIQPDIVHLHNIHGYYLDCQVMLNYLAQANIPIVWTLHDCWTFTGHCTHFENACCEKWKIECDHCPLLMAQYKSRLFDRSRKNFLLKKNLYSKLSNVTIVPVSHWLGGLVSQSILKRFPIKVIQNGIDLNVFKPQSNTIRHDLNIAQDKTILLGVVGSGFDEEKGKKEFIELSKYSKYQIILVGLSKKEARDLPDNIIVIERTSDQTELAKYYTAADVFLNPTYNDTFPTTNIEAQACGTPVVTYRTGGSPETIDLNTGFVVEKGDLKGIKNAIEKIRTSSLDSYSLACRERTEKLFNKDERFMDYIKLYESLLSKD